MTTALAIAVTARLLGLFAILQGIGFMKLTRFYSDQGVWRWADLSEELGAWLGLLLSARVFAVLNVVRVAAGVACVVAPNAAALVVLLAIHVLTLLRWRGTFNGGSDYMNLATLLCVSLATLHPPAARGCLWYISIQLMFSYLNAGLFKIARPEWRTGSALRAFLSSRRYVGGGWLLSGVESAGLMRMAAWSVMFFEISFPVVFVGPQVAVTYVFLAIAFHLANAYTFGLSRFFWAWLCAYPALLYCA